VLLLLSAVPFLFLVPSVSSQTSFVTTTSEFYRSTFTVPGTATGYCYYQNITLGTGRAGTELFGSVSATIPIQFAIMNQAQYITFRGHSYKSNNCRLAAEAVLYQDSVTNYPLDWVVPDNDTYYFIFFNPNNVDVQSTFALWTTIGTTRTTAQSSASIYATSTAPIPTQASTSTSITSTSTITQLSTSTTYSMITITTTPSSSAPTTALPMPPVTVSPQSDYGWLLPALVLGVAAVVTFMLVAYAYPRIFSGTTEPKVTEPRPTTSVAQTAEKATGKQFCLNCGAELPAKSKFCNKCGSAQT
jgi:ribosomal protein L40E